MSFDPKVDLGLIVSVVIFIAGYVLTQWLKRIDQNHNRRKLLLALHIEIEKNVGLLRDAIAAYPGHHELSRFMKDHGGRPPHFIFSYVGDIYRTNLDLLTAMEPAVIRTTISFYGNLEYIRAIIESVRLESFTIISDQGRENCLTVLKETLERSEEKGNNLLSALSLLLPEMSPQALP